MRQKDIIKALQNVSEKNAVQLGEEYHGIADIDHERLLRKVEQRLEKTIRSSYRIIRDISLNRPTRSDIHDSRPYCLGQKLDMRLAAMTLALQRISSHYKLDDFAI